MLEILDVVPPEGDWPEGVNYWFATLNRGLRLIVALQRLTGGAIDLFVHPALDITGDFAAMLTTPAGWSYNFNDNRATLAGPTSEALAVLGAEKRRGDWLAVARQFPTDSLQWLASDDPAVPDAAPPPIKRDARNDYHVQFGYLRLFLGQRPKTAIRLRDVPSTRFQLI